MWMRLKAKGIKASRSVVRLTLKFLTPRLVEQRRRRRFQRRDYVNPGPNFCWHVDGYDKLKKYGFAKHGGIDGYSRRLMWLHVGVTNNHPQVTALYFARTVSQLKIVPCLLRCDRGTENVHLEKMQKFWRRNGTDMFAGVNSFLYGRSTANQRIEAFWAVLRRQCTNFWMNMFSDMVQVGLFDVSDKVHIECARFCFMGLLRKELNAMFDYWNSHYIYANKRKGQISGKPDKMYFLPKEYNTDCYGCEYNEGEVNPVIAELEVDEGNPFDVHPDFVELVNILIPSWTSPNTVREAQELFVRILQAVQAHENR